MDGGNVMKRNVLSLLLCAAMLLSACTAEVPSATEAPQTVGPTSPAAEEPTPSAPTAQEPVASPEEEPEPLVPPTENAEPVEPPVEAPKPVEPPVEAPEPVEPPVEAPEPGETPVTTLENYDEYLAYLATADLPTTFVPYEAIAALGEFHHFVCLSDDRYGDYSHYMYTLVDETGTEFVLYVEFNRNGPVLTPLPIIDDINPQDMRQTLFSNKGRYIHRGIEYKYIRTGLLSITWENQGHIFVLSGDNLGGYPQGADTFVAKLMNLSLAGQALASIGLAPEERM